MRIYSTRTEFRKAPLSKAGPDETRLAGGAKIVGRRLARATIGYDLVADLLAFAKAGHAGGNPQTPGGGKDFSTFDVAPAVAVIVGDDLDACRAPLKMSLALYIGGMGARDKNFYNDYIRKIGFEAEAMEIQKLYLDGKKGEAVAKVPDALVDALHLVGPKERIRDRFQAWKASKVTTLIVGAMQKEALRLIAELALS